MSKTIEPAAGRPPLRLHPWAIDAEGAPLELLPLRDLAERLAGALAEKAPHLLPSKVVPPIVAAVADPARAERWPLYLLRAEATALPLADDFVIVPGVVGKAPTVERRSASAVSNWSGDRPGRLVHVAGRVGRPALVGRIGLCKRLADADAWAWLMTAAIPARLAWPGELAGRMLDGAAAAADGWPDLARLLRAVDMEKHTKKPGRRSRTAPVPGWPTNLQLRSDPDLAAKWLRDHEDERQALGSIDAVAKVHDCSRDTVEGRRRAAKEGLRSGTLQGVWKSSKPRLRSG